MSEIHIKTPNSPYETVLDTGAMDVLIKKAYLGMVFVSDDGEMLAVSMRDGGFEVKYWGDFGEEGFDLGFTQFKDGTIIRPGDRYNSSERV